MPKEYFCYIFHLVQHVVLLCLQEKTDTSISDSFGRQCGPVFRLSFFDVYDWPPQANLVNNLLKWSVKLHVLIDIFILSDPVKLINCKNNAKMDNEIANVNTPLLFKVKQLNFISAMIKLMLKLHVSIDLCILSDLVKLVNCKNNAKMDNEIANVNTPLHFQVK